MEHRSLPSRPGVGHEVRSDRMVPPPGAPTRTPPPTPDGDTVPVGTGTGPGGPVAPGVCVPHCGPIGPTTGQETDMASEVRGVVALAEGRPVSVVTIVVPDPGPGEAVVRVQACGVCHTDLHYREGAINDDFPFLLGHEAAGIVESVGAGVTTIEPGDFVVLNWRA